MFTNRTTDGRNNIAAADFVLFWRTLSDKTWRYGGTYKSVEAAKRKARKVLGKAQYQYKIEDSSGSTVAIDSVNF